MIDTQKFYADVKRCLKHERSDNAGLYNGLHASQKVADIFKSYLSDLGCVPDSLADYWLKHKIEPSANPQNQPDQQNIDWLANALSLLDGQLESDQDFTAQDWEEIKTIINCEAEDLPIDTLTAIMSTFLDRKVF